MKLEIFKIFNFIKYLNYCYIYVYTKPLELFELGVKL